MSTLAIYRSGQHSNHFDLGLKSSFSKKKRLVLNTFKKKKIKNNNNKQQQAPFLFGPCTLALTLDQTGWSCEASDLFAKHCESRLCAVHTRVSLGDFIHKLLFIGFAFATRSFTSTTLNEVAALVETKEQTVSGNLIVLNRFCCSFLTKRRRVLSCADAVLSKVSP